MKIKDSYLNDIVRIIISLFYYFIICILCIIILSRLGVDFKEYGNDLLFLYLILFLLFLFYQSLDNKIFFYLKKEFIKSKSLYVVTLPIIMALLENIIIYISRYIPLCWGGDVIGIGLNQAIISLKMCTLEFWICNCIFPALNEEIMFRFFMYIGLFIIINNISRDNWNLKTNSKLNNNYFIMTIYKINNCLSGVKNDLFIEKKSYAVIGWIIVTSTLFALAHGTNITNFYMYFIPGALFAMLYLKYGLLSSMLCHMLSNYFSPIVHHILLVILKCFFII